MTVYIYPEISKVGSLTKALDKEFEKIHSSLTCTIDDDLDKLPFAYARVELTKDQSNIMMYSVIHQFLLSAFHNPPNLHIEMNASYPCRTFPYHQNF